MALPEFTFPLLDSISTGLMMVDKNYNIVYWNYYMEKYTGISRKDALNKNFKVLFPEFNTPYYIDRINSIFDGWPPVVLSPRLHSPFFSSNKDLHPRFQEITISTFNSNTDGVEYLMFTISDVTQTFNKIEELRTLYINAQEELEYRAKMQEAILSSERRLQEVVKTKDKLFSIIAHDLISPFQAIIGLSELLEKSYEEEESENFPLFLNEIQSASKSTYNLLNNLLEWSRIQTGRLEFSPSKCNISEILEEISQIFKSLAIQKEIEIQIRCPKNIYLIADPNMIRVVFRNIVSNAIKYSKRGSSIDIEIQQANNYLDIQFIDYGIGMNQEQIESILGDQNTVSVRGTENEKGSGLGLLLCNEFISKHQGLFKIESKIGNGTSITVSLPIEPIN